MSSRVPTGTLLRQGRLTAFVAAGAALLIAGSSVAQAGPTPPAGLTASASFEPVVQYLNDAAGTVFHFSIHNTGSVSIGAVEIARPDSSWGIAACPTAPTGWAVQRSGKSCKFRSTVSPADDLVPGVTNGDFAVRATTTSGAQDRTGTWRITVSKSNKFDGKSRFYPASPEGSGLTTKAYAIQVLDAAVGDGGIGAPCPAPDSANHGAPASSSQTIVICGRNRSSAAMTAAGGQSSLAGDFAGAGTFTGGSVAANSGNVILGKWTGTTIGASVGVGNSVVATIGASSSITSPVTTLDDTCPAPSGTTDCVANGGYEITSGGGGNTPPVATDDSGAGFGTDEDTSFTTGNVLANDTDADNDTLSVSNLDTTGTKGLVTDNGDGTFGYDPNGQFESLNTGDSDTDTFTYTVSDGNGGTDTATVTIAISGVTDGGGGNTPPDAVDDTTSLAEDAGATAIDVLGNDTDADNDTLVISLASDPANGTVVLTGGSPGAATGLTYEPDADFCNDPPGTTTDDFTYTISDANGGSDTANVSVTVTCVNDAPVVTASAGSTSFLLGAGPVVVDPGITVSDVDSATLQGGTVIVNFGNFGDTLLFAPYGPISGSFDSNTFALTLTGAADAATYQAALRTITFSAASAGVTPSRTIAFAVTDGTDQSSFTAKTVTVDTAPPNTPPVAGDDSGTGFGTDEDTSFTTGNVLANDTDADNDTLSVSNLDTTATLGLVTNNADGTFTYDPNGQFEGLTAGQTGSDTFSYTVSDGNGGTDTATVTIAISQVNDPPNAVDDGGGLFTTDEDSAFTTENVLDNDGDPDSDTLTVQSFDDSLTLGTVTDNGDGTFGYDPNGKFENLNTGGSATDTFTYTVSDGHGGTDTATVTITINGITDGGGGNSAPDAVDDGGTGFTTDEDTGFTTGSALANDTDPDNDTLTVDSIDTTGTVGNVTDNGDGTFAYDPNGQFESLPAGQSTTDTLTYTISDGNGHTDTATVTITINGVNDPPVASDDGGASFTTSEDASFTTANVLTNDTDADSGDTLSVLSFDDSLTLGTVTDNGDGTFGYDPAGAWDGLGATDSDVDTFEYTVTDGHGGTDTAIVTITINGANDAPDAVDDTNSTDEDTAKTFDPRGNDTDPDASDVITITAVGTPTNGGTASIQNFGSQVKFDPGTDFQDLLSGQSRDSSFTYTISDGNGGTDTATITFTVSGVDDAPVADDETFSGSDAAVGNTTLVVDDPTDAAPAAASPKKVITGDILAGDTDVDGPGPLSVVAGTFTTNDGGSVTVEADGDFTYQPAAATSCTDTSDFFDYTVTDNGTSPQTDVGRVTINISGCVWYVSNSAAGNSGTSWAPFDTLAQAGTASAASSDIYVFRGDGTATGLTTTLALKASQRLVGEAVALVVGGVTLQPAGNRPSLVGSVQVDDANTVTGVAISASGGAAIAGASGDVTGTITNVTISGTTAGIQLSQTSGTWTLTDVTISMTSGDAIAMQTAGSIVFTPTGTISLATAAGHGALIGGSTTSGTIDSVTVTSSATTGIDLNGNLGSLVIDDVNLTTTGTGLSIESSNDVTVNSSGDADITSSGTAVSMTTNASNPANMPDVALDQVSSSGGTAGIILNDIGDGTFSAAGGSLSGHTTAEIQIVGGSGNVTYPGTIGNGTGLSLDIHDRTGGTVTLANTITDTSDAGGGIRLDNNDGSTINLGGNITLITTTGDGFVATNGGTVNVTGSANTVTTTTGTGVNISGTTIGASNVTFDTVNVDGTDALPANGIVISGTGSSGHFSVTGTGSAGSGGTIQDTAGDGILLVDTTAPSISSMTITSNLGNGIHGGNGTAGGLVVGATLASLVVSNNGNDAGAEDGILFQGLTGTASFSGLDVSGSSRHNIGIINNTGTLASLTISGSTIHDNAATGSNGLTLIADGTATMTVSVGTTTFDQNHTTGVLAQTISGGNMTVAVTGLGTAGGNPATFTNNFVSAEFDTGGTGSMHATLSAAKITNSNLCTNGALPCGAPVNLFVGTNATSASTLNATITGNTINNGGSVSAPGIWVHTGTPFTGHARISLTSNIISGVGNRGIDIGGGGCAAGATCNGTIDATVSGNTVSITDGVNGLEGIGLSGATNTNDTVTFCLDVFSNVSTSAAADGLRVRQRQLSTVKLPSYGGSAFDTTAVNAYLAGRNGSLGDTISSTANNVAGAGGFIAGTCLTPS